MILTEEEAKTKQCQESLGAPHHYVSQNYLAMAAPRRCIGSACMAWEWESRRPNNATSGEEWLGYCGKSVRR